MVTASSVKKLKVAELKTELSSRGLSTKGKKDELVKRLLQALDEDGENVDQDASQTSIISTGDETANDSQDSLNESQDLPPSQDKSEQDLEPSVKGTSESNEAAIAVGVAENDDKQDDDWVMVEPPKAEEVEAASQLAEKQDEASETNVGADVDMKEDQSEPAKEDDKPADQQPEDTAMTETSEAEVKKDESKVEEDTPMEQEATTNDSTTESQEKATDTKVGETQDKDGDLKESKKEENTKKEEKTKKEEPKPEDKYVEVEAEDGEDIDIVEIEDGHIGLDSYSSDLNFVVGEKGLSGHNLVKNGFSYMWAGARANKGAKGGKVGYEVKILENLSVELPEDETPINAIRVGWSTENSILQLGEAEKSYGYESTGKLCASSSFVNYGETFAPGDVIGSFLDLENEPKKLHYTKNGKDLGLAMSLQVNLSEKPLFPHILVRNAKVQVNFGANDEPWFEPLEEYQLLQNAGSENIAERQTSPPESKEKCEVLLMVGLPNSGKTTWAKKYVEAHANKQFNLIGLSSVLERCRLEGKRRKRSDKGHENFMKNVIKILSKSYELCSKKARNYILDQNNVYEVAQTSKMERFNDFTRKAVVVVPTHDNLRKRTSETKRKGENIHDIPFGDLCDMKCEFNIPEVGSLFSEVIYPELDERNARKTVSDYKSDGTRAKKTGKDEFYPKKKSRHDDRYGRDRYGRYRDDGWRHSGSGYGGGYASGGYGSNRNYGDKYGNRYGGSYNRGRDNYQDSYRRHSGGSSGGGYRQNSGYGSGGYNRNSGANYSQGSYGSGGYGGNYGSSGYQSGYGNYNQYGQSNQRASGGSNWGQYNQTGNYSQSGWSTSNSGSTGGWSGYNTYGGYYSSGSGNYGSGSGGYSGSY